MHKAKREAVPRQSRAGSSLRARLRVHCALFADGRSTGPDRVMRRRPIAMRYSASRAAAPINDPMKQAEQGPLQNALLFPPLRHTSRWLTLQVEGPGSISGCEGDRPSHRHGDDLSGRPLLPVDPAAAALEGYVHDWG